MKCLGERIETDKNGIQYSAYVTQLESGREIIFDVAEVLLNGDSAEFMWQFVWSGLTNEEKKLEDIWFKNWCTT